MLLHKSYTSPGCCSENFYKYGQVVKILSVLVTSSNLMLLVITVWDVDVGRANHQTFKTGTFQEERSLILGIKAVSILYISLQIILLFISLKTLFYQEAGSFVLTVGVKEANGHQITCYGATGTSGGPLSNDDITVYYRRVGKSTYIAQFEALTLPASSWLLSGQILSLLFSIINFGLYVVLFNFNRNHIYNSITGVSFITLIQQMFQVFLTYFTSTEIGFCCFGISYARWFLHQDFYTKMLRSVILKKFHSSSRFSTVSHLFRISEESLGESYGENLDRAGEVRLLQHLLETTHDSFYRQVYPGQEVAVSLFLTSCEISALSNHFMEEQRRGQEEMVIYSVTPDDED